MSEERDVGDLELYSEHPILGKSRRPHAKIPLYYDRPCSQDPTPTLADPHSWVSDVVYIWGQCTLGLSSRSEPRNVGRSFLCHADGKLLL